MQKLLSVVAALYVAATMPGTAIGADTRAYGGNGGGQYRTTCGHGAFLVGIAGRSGDWVDAITPICSSWDAATKSIGSPVQGPTEGGAGGSPGSVLCPRGTAIKGMQVVAIDNGGQVLVRYVLPHCQAIPQDASRGYVFVGAFGGAGSNDGSHTDAFDCANGELANGLHGGSGAYVDRVGLTCAPVPFHLGRPVPAPSIPGASDRLVPSPIQRRTTGVTYDLPMIVAANGERVRLDYCREYGSGCGKAAADAFCERNGHAGASRFQIDNDIGHTAIISGGLCNDATCDGFTKIECNP